MTCSIQVTVTKLCGWAPQGMLLLGSFIHSQASWWELLAAWSAHLILKDLCSCWPCGHGCCLTLCPGSQWCCSELFTKRLFVSCLHMEGFLVIVRECLPLFANVLHGLFVLGRVKCWTPQLLSLETIPSWKSSYLPLHWLVQSCFLLRWGLQWCLLPCLSWGVVEVLTNWSRFTEQPEPGP